MKQVLSAIISLLFLSSVGFSQNVGIGTNTPNANALLDLKSGSKGLLVPRMDSTSRKAIPNTKGLLVYDSTYSSFYFNNGTSWQKMSGSTGGSQLIANGNNVGDMLFWNGSNWDVVPAGKGGQYLQFGTNNTPAWTGDEFPKVQTLPVTNIGSRSATGNMTLISMGLNQTNSGSQFSYHYKGVCFSTTANPVISSGWINQYTDSNSTIGNYSYDIGNLLVNTTYYVRSFGYNNAGVGYGNQLSFTTLNGPVSLPRIGLSNNETISDSTIVGIYSEVSDQGGALVTSRGLVYGTNSNPTIANSVISNGTGAGSFITNINHLLPNTTYFIRAYATNSAGTAYSDQIMVTTTPTIVTICGAKWAKQNLRRNYYTYCNGCSYTSINQLSDSVSWSQQYSYYPAAWCWYKNDSATYASTYGMIYNKTASSLLFINGWHIPTLSEAKALLKCLDASYDSSQLISYVAGGALKEAGTSHWRSPNAGASNTSGFTGLPGGMRNVDASFSGQGTLSAWWVYDSVTQNYYILKLSNTTPYATLTLATDNEGCSIRLVKDN